MPDELREKMDIAGQELLLADGSTNPFLAGAEAMWAEVGETLEDYEDMKFQNDRLKEVIQYLPSIPTEPYEKRLAKEHREMKDENARLKRALESLLNRAEAQMDQSDLRQFPGFVAKEARRALEVDKIIRGEEV